MNWQKKGSKIYCIFERKMYKKSPFKIMEKGLTYHKSFLQFNQAVFIYIYIYMYKSFTGNDLTLIHKNKILADENLFCLTVI